MSENFSISLQENLVTLLCFSDEYVGLIVNNISVEHFDNTYYRRIVEVAVDYYKRFNETPKNHIADLLEPELNSKGEIYEKILRNIYENYETINVQYIVDSLEKFIKAQELKKALKKSVELLQVGKVDEAEEVLESSRRRRISVFDPGVLFGFDDKTYQSIDSLEEDLIYTGIKTLDELEHVPTKRELYTLMAPPGRGKSWMLVHVGKHALLQRKKVLHISLEMDERRVIGRYFQSLFGITSKSEDFNNRIPIFETDRFGSMTNISFKEIGEVKSLREANIFDYLKDQMKTLIKPQLMIKQFPTGTLSVSALKAYLDNLEGYYNFIPDIILLDYLDLMEIDTEKLRIDLGRTAVDLRGLAIERNTAMVTVAQTNRTGEDKILLTRKHLGEDYSKVKTTDVLVTYNQNNYEKELGLARLYVDKGRNGKDGDVILITQNYSIGAFCLQSMKMKSNYWKLLEEMKK